MTSLVTGASGFIGSHIAERIARKGEHVRCLVRPTSDVSFLRSIGAEVVYGDITDAPSLTAALRGADCVYHAAAFVSEWGPWERFRIVTINGTRNMLKAAAAAGVRRFLHVSTDGVYRLRDLHRGVDEDSPLEAQFGPLDYYRRSKTAAERIANRFGESGSLDVRIVRPALVLGERDAAMMPGLIAFLKSRAAAIVGSGNNRLPVIYAGDVAEICVLATGTDDVTGKIFNAVNPEPVTQLDLYQAVAEATGLKVPRRKIPFRLLYALAAGMEGTARIRGGAHRPELTRFGINLVGLDYRESASKTIQELGWKPEATMAEAVARSVEWSRNHRVERAGTAAG
jgi:nucleoside-diphosphate-sugar epimerase